jgi:hypothetical protein
MKTPAFLFIALAMSASAFSQTSVPAAPTLTAGAEFKGLRFDWDTVAGATWYQLEYRAHQTSDFVQLGDDYPATATSTHFSFPVHLYDWTYARYRLAACNSAGCSRSAPVSVSNLRLDAVGYFKSSQPQAEAMFGATGDLSPDGYNFVVAAPQENVAEVGAFFDGGAAYVFRRGSDGKWFQRARLDVHDYVFAYDGTDVNVATSGSGNTVAVALQTYSTTSGDQPGLPQGEVDVYRAKPGSGSYTRTRIPRPDVDRFGTSVALSESGSILAVGVSSDQTSVAIYKLVNGVWQNVRNLPGSQGGVEDYCYSAVMSRDGKAVAQLCQTSHAPLRPYVRMYSGSNWSVRTDIDLDAAWSHRGLAIDGTGGTIAVQFEKAEDPSHPSNLNGTAQVRVYKRGSAGFSQVASLAAGAWRTKNRGYEYGTTLSLSGDGHTLAVGDIYDNGTGTGPRAAPLVSGTAQTGAVYVYRLTDTWRLANVMKPNYLPSTPGVWGFGWVISLSRSGKTLLIPVANESSSAKGIDGNWANADLHRSGAAFLY